MDFEIVTRADVTPRRRAGKAPSPVSLAIEAGQVVFIPGARRHLGLTPQSYLHLRGIKVTQRSGEHNGVSGVFAWRADLDAE